jgi:hypothetical protein
MCHGSQENIIDPNEVVCVHMLVNGSQGSIMDPNAMSWILMQVHKS